MKKLLSLSALAGVVLAFAPLASADIVTQMTLSDTFGDSISLDVSSAGVLSFVCNSGTCSGINATNTTVDKAHGTIDINGGTLGGGANTFTINATGKGGADSFLPTLQNLNQINALNNSTTAATLTTFFTDTLYNDMSSTLNVANSNTTDVGISSSTVTFDVFTSATNQLAGGTMLETDTLTNHSDNNGANGVNVANPNSPSGSLTTETVLKFTGAGDIQANNSISNVAAVPEPTSVVLFGSLFVGIAAAMKRKRKSNTV